MTPDERADAVRPRLSAQDAPTERVSTYVRRMQHGLLAAWPEEVLTQWLHRHGNQVEDWSFLPYERFRFEIETWAVENLPGREAFSDPAFFDAFSRDLDYRAESNRHDWLAHYMLREGTWNTPPIVLEHLEAEYRDTGGRFLGTPYQLLEGHRRLSFAHFLKNSGRARPQHTVWVARIM